MNLYLRLLLLLLKLPFVRHRGVFEPSRIHFRVLPNDCDINLHMNNGRYLTFLDLGRTHLTAQTGLLSVVLKRRWQPVLAAAEINFIRALPPFARFTIVSRLMTWDEKYFYIEQRFERGGDLCAMTFVKAVFLANGKRLASAEVLKALGVKDSAPTVPPALRHWIEMSELKKQHTAVR